MNSDMPKQIKLPLDSLISVFLLYLLALAGCSPSQVQLANTPTFATTPILVQPTSTSIPVLPTPTPILVQPTKTHIPVLPTITFTPGTPPSTFPLAGTWTGIAVNGTARFSVTITINPACAVGVTCGTFNIPIVPCSGTYVMVGKQNDQYEFRMENKSATCGEGKDYLQLLPDGTLKFISQGNFGENDGILTLVSPQVSISTRLPVIFDDDGSPDGTTALLYLLSDPIVSVQAVIISHGEAHPKIYIQHMGRMLDSFGIIGIPLGPGQDTGLIPSEDFPDWLRQSADNFWGFPVPNAKKTYPTQDAAQLMVSLLNQASAPMAIFVSGSSTDLARALRLDPGIREHISAVYVMGGAIYVPGNLTDFSTNPKNVSAEWNIYIDPLAASEVLESGLKIVLVPLDATNQVSAMMADTRQWRAGGKLAGFAAELYDMLLGGSSTKQMGLWDVMTAEIMVHPKLCATPPCTYK